ncbi:hypothetical protein [Staphylococcus haemolyticus]|uniref:hypothetical protein n=1 Tax=Staphylococcus haemolyticus TaxID=1283 RepID=UPI002ACDCCDD|nr:hypothetical protein [Staphylococcus haemolyticus]
MSKIKQTDIAKLSQLEQHIEQLKEQKKKQEAQLSYKIGGYFLNELDLNMINSSDELYKIMDKVIEEFNQDIEQNGSNRNNENLKENEINQNSK